MDEFEGLPVVMRNPAVFRPSQVPEARVARDVLLNNIAWTLRKFPLTLLPGRGQYGIQATFVENLAQLAVEDAVGSETFAYAEKEGKSQNFPPRRGQNVWHQPLYSVAVVK